MPQVDKETYNFSDYVNKGRWVSYWHQLHEITSEKVSGANVLIIGAGDKIVPSVLKSFWGYVVTVFDFDKNLEPDIVGDVRALSKYVKTESYDVVLCCQVLEHIPRSEFGKVLWQIESVLKKDGVLVLSLPQSNAPFQIRVDIPKIHFRINKSIAKFKNRIFQFDGEHYWEVDTKGCMKKEILAEIKKLFTVKKSYTVFEHAYHWFVIAKK